MSREDLEKRQVLWLALSELYLDTELSDQDYNFIKVQVLQAGFSLQDAESIDRYEVFPLLYSNLLSPVGVWSGFDKNWLYQNCEKYYTIRGSLFHQWKCDWLCMIYGKIRKDIWAKLNS
ncbi:hypothetical protein N7E81_03695 [Reichenbachiella carrageenanivorans]|uniref:DUF7079 domain-containing protein n=1 Tax=Reichenbachiella carrageenanivorans TaxID=2979869 RepID=A0ABY6D216_9BACT|nr:hypothetical protein [Reichenbachiella carrageenanivorans]UXX80201.1 hypothetical protein N7E81_03695 [Reichenbachiella carrageenanivorans]